MQGLSARPALERFDLFVLRPGGSLKVASPFSDSGLETFVVPRLLWLRLPIVPAGLDCRASRGFSDRRATRLLIDGGHHLGAQREADNQHDAQLMLMGYHVVRVGYCRSSIGGTRCRT